MRFNHYKTKLVKSGKDAQHPTSTGYRKIEIQSLRDRRKSPGNIQEEMAQCNVKVSARTVRCRLEGFGPNARMPRKSHC